MESKPLKWLDNFWYHYKWHTIIAAFFALILIVSLVQCASVEETDVKVSVAGNVVLGDAEQEGLKKLLGDVCPRDLDGDGEKNASLSIFSVFNEEQLEDHFTYYDEEAGEYCVDRDTVNLYRSTNVDNHKNLQTYVMTGDCAV